MFFDVKGICWTLAALTVVVLVCSIDLCCSSGRRDSAQAGAIDRVKGEISAGRSEWATQRRDQLNLQIRDLRVRARAFVKEGRTVEARKILVVVQELEREAGKIR